MEVSRSKTNQRTEALQAQRKTEQRDQAARQQQQAADEARARERAKENRPVVNTQGHSTGRLLNVTA
ncbi:hypothetical protein RQP54_14405 [Curvibacter sp. APW13]|uniref:hypothetical protein n=1 Tax=Curvibacter sp. APW13 TaxID=3077236 RepID=UPI0028DFB558|nr:hypothetical protein [Curvibacter sp. APW13]MDT8992061.1 hypothetical protein [Curvibacter sp. APW13]